MRGGVGFVAAARGNERLREGAAVRQWTGDSNFFVSGADIASGWSIRIPLSLPLILPSRLARLLCAFGKGPLRGSG
jgi:hypothetical protein